MLIPPYFPKDEIARNINETVDKVCKDIRDFAEYLRQKQCESDTTSNEKEHSTMKERGDDGLGVPGGNTMSDEYISREAAKMAACKLCEWYGSKFCSDNKCDDHPIDAVPAADVKPVVRGEWIQTSDHSAICTACGTTTLVGGVDRTGQALIHKGLFNFCPKCGADMRKEANDER